MCFPSRDICALASSRGKTGILLAKHYIGRIHSYCSKFNSSLLISPLYYLKENPLCALIEEPDVFPVHTAQRTGSFAFIYLYFSAFLKWHMEYVVYLPYSNTLPACSLAGWEASLKVNNFIITVAFIFFFLPLCPHHACYRLPESIKYVKTEACWEEFLLLELEKQGKK